MLKKLSIILLSLVMTVGLAGCKEVRRALRANSAVITGVSELQAQTIDAFTKEEIGLGEARGIVTYTTESLQVARELNNVLNATDKWNDASKARVIILAEQLAESLHFLNTEGVLRVKNPAVKATLNATLIGIQASMIALGEVYDE